ncbi:MAG: T9SS type A sorting domain-containing protein [Aequorivita antarctica]
MKYLLLSFGLVFSSTFLHAQIVNIPDANFKNALINTNCVDTDGDYMPDSDADTNNDGEIQVSEAEAIYGLYVYSQNINSIEGIESFTNLEVLVCFRNNLSNIDVSENLNLLGLNCTDNPIGSLDVTNNLNLIGLTCQDNNLTTLDISQNPNLDHLVCSFNSLTEINLSLHPNLRILQIDNNLFTEIDLSSNPQLYFFSCTNNQFNHLDVSHNPLLDYINFDNNEITSLDLSQNPDLVDIIGNNNNLRNLNIQNGNNTILYSMKVSNNPNLLCIQVDDENYANSRTCNANRWCKDVTASYSELCELVGIEDLSSVDFKLFPNPTENILNIQSNNPIENVKIYSLQGILVNEYASNSIDVSQLSSGMYFVEVMADGKSATQKFIKM